MPRVCCRRPPPVDGRALDAYTRVIPDGSREKRERVAQLVEHLTFNQRVMGSSPIALTNKINKLQVILR